MSPVRDTQALFAELRRWADERGPAAREHAYGSLPDQHGVLRLPRGSGPHPVAAVFHGGFWRSQFTRRNTEAVAAALTELGWATWNVEYRRVGAGGGYPETLDDLRSACRALASIDAPIDPGATVAVGHSAGGQLALWAAAEGLVAGAVALAGVCDLGAAFRADLGDGAVAGFLGGPPELVPERYADADPALRLPLGRPMLLVHGTDDDRVPIGHVRAFAEAALEAGDRCRLLELDGADHFDVVDPRTRAWAEAGRAVAELLS